MALTADKANLVLAAALNAAPLPSTDNEPNMAAASVQALTQRSSGPALFSDGGTAAAAVGEEVIFAADVPCQITGVAVAFPVAVTANNSNYATITINKRTNAAPGTAVQVSQVTTQITDPTLGANAVAFQRYLTVLNATLANIQMAAGDVLTIVVTKTGTGVALGSANASASATVFRQEL